MAQNHVLAEDVDSVRQTSGIVAAPLAALLIIHTELVFVFRSLFWEETGIIGWIGPAVAVGVVAIAIALPIGVLNALSSKWIHSKTMRRIAFHLMLNTVVVAIAASYFVLGEEFLQRPLVEFVALWTVFNLATVATRRSTRLSSATIARLTILSAITGIIITYSIANALFAYPEERSNVLKYAGPAAVVCALAWYLLTWIISYHSVHTAKLRAIIITATLLAAAFGPAIATAALRTPSSTDRPNLVLITCDTLRADYTSAYGGETPTPSMERLAKNGTTFEHAYSLAPWTVPSMFGLFSSNYPPTLQPGGGFDQWLAQVAAYRVPSNHVPLAERLSQAGYTTAAYVGNPLLGRGSGMLRGFQTARAWPTHVPRIKGPLANAPGLYALLARLRSDESAPPPFDSSRVLTQSAIQFLRQNADGSFYLWIHIMDPHDPYDPPTRFRTHDGPWRVFGPASPHWGSPQLDERGRINVDQSDWDYVRSLYRGEIQYADACIDTLLKELDDLGVLDNTFVCLNADHGEELWDRQRFGHGHSLHDELVHVPMMFTGPGITKQVIDQPVSAIDVMPTLAALMEIQPDAGWRGRDLSPLLRSSTLSAFSPVIAQATNRNAWPDVLRMYRSERWKLIESLGQGPTALYDMHTDPQERNNILDANPEVVAELETALRDWERDAPPSYNLTDDSADVSPEAEMLENLRSLGYVE